MCCDANDYNVNEINGECPDCGGDTVDGDAFDVCGYSPINCNTCGCRPCDESC
jgi:hypothetical protein